MAEKPIMFINNLPPSLAVAILGEWVSTKELTRIDIAMCEKSSRKYYMDLMREGRCVTYGFDRLPKDMERPFILWLISRSISVQSLVIHDLSFINHVTDRHYGSLCDSLKLLELAYDLKNTRMKLKVADFVSFLGRCSRLKKLVARNCDLMQCDAFLAVLCGCSNLEYLDVRYCDTLENFDSRPSLPACRTGTTCQLQELTDLPSNSLPPIEHLDVSHIRRMPVNFFHGFVAKCTKLVELNISGCSNIDDELVVTIVNNCPLIQSLNLRYCSSITDESLEAISKLGDTLTILSVGGCFRITEDAFDSLLRSCSCLSRLDIGGCRKLGEGAMLSISSHCDGLKELNVVNNARVKAPDLLRIVQCCLSLRQLDARYCIHITDNDKANLESLSYSLSKEKRLQVFIQSI